MKRNPKYNLTIESLTPMIGKIREILESHRIQMAVLLCSTPSLEHAAHQNVFYIYQRSTRRVGGLLSMPCRNLPLRMPGSL